MDALNCFYSSPISSNSGTYRPEESSRESLQNDIIISALQIASQLARNSESYFSQLLSVFVPRTLINLLTHPCDVIRAKSCNLVGNICRFEFCLRFVKTVVVYIYDALNTVHFLFRSVQTFGSILSAVEHFD
jgi:hypothetical protein